MNIDFNRLNKMWGEKPVAKETEDKPDYEEVPDGNYLVYVEKVGWRTSRAGNAYLSWQLRVMTGEHEGRCIFKKSMCTSPENMKFLFEDIASCGGTPPDADLSSLDLNDLIDRALEVRKYTKEGDSGSFVNVYFNKYMGHRDEVRSNIRVDGYQAPEGGPKPEGKRFDDEEIPF